MLIFLFFFDNIKKKIEEIILSQKIYIMIQMFDYYEGRNKIHYIQG